MLDKHDTYISILVKIVKDYTMFQQCYSTVSDWNYKAGLHTYHVDSFASCKQAKFNIILGPNQSSFGLNPYII